MSRQAIFVNAYLRYDKIEIFLDVLGRFFQF